MSSYPTAISIREVGPRDGLQSESPVPTEGKIELLNALSRTGVQRIEAVSFVHPRAIPQMADANDVWNACEKNPAVTYSALVPNLKGAERAVAAGFNDIEVVVSASTTHNKANLNASTEESLAALEPVSELVHAANGTLEVIISTAFGCPYEGDVPVERVVSVAQAAVRVGANRLAFGDTTGMGTPTRVTALVEAIRSARIDLPLLMHFHNTRGTGLTNVLAALQAGVTEFDSSVGGLGGCPYAPGATGNIATEELVHMCEDMGIATGINLDALLEAAHVAQRLVGRDLPSGVLKAGPRSRTISRG